MTGTHAPSVSAALGALKSPDTCFVHGDGTNGVEVWVARSRNGPLFNAATRMLVSKGYRFHLDTDRGGADYHVLRVHSRASR